MILGVFLFFETLSKFYIKSKYFKGLGSLAKKAKTVFTANLALKRKAKKQFSVDFRLKPLKKQNINLINNFVL